MRVIGVVTVARSDYGIYLPLLREIRSDPDCTLHLLVCGMHLSPEFGMTAGIIESDGFPIGDRIEMLLSSDSPEGIAKSMGLGTIGFSQAFARMRPDILVVLGDRFEMHCAVVAALPFKIPVAHIHGGELTLGAMDNSLRHSITKMSHLHFVSTEEYGRRVIQMGEESWRVFVVGSMSLDQLTSLSLLDTRDLESRYGVSCHVKPLLVTFHPVTLEYEQTEWQITELLAALDRIGMPVVFTSPNADTAGRCILSKIEDFVRSHPASSTLVPNFGTQAYFSMMKNSAAMIGNSSSGIIEAASFRLPVVNVGTRQAGRVRGKNVIDCGYHRDEIVTAAGKALAAGFREQLSEEDNPYYREGASHCTLAHLKTITLDERLIVKEFADFPGLR